MQQKLFCVIGITDMSDFKKDMLHENANKEDVRLNRFLSDAGFAPEERLTG